MKTNFPKLKADAFPERITVCVTSETKNKLTHLKLEKRIDTSELIRIAISRILEEAMNEDATA